MRRVVQSLLLPSWKQFCAREMSTSGDSWPKIILFGDSITQFSFSADGCWGALLADHVQRKCDVINRGFSGYTVRWCHQMLPQVVTPNVGKEAAAVTIFLGANDSNDFETNPRQHVPMAEYTEGLTSMVEHLLSVGISREKIILITPPAFHAPAWQEECIKKGRPLSKNNVTTGQYAKACASVAKQCGTQLVDFYSHMMDLPNWDSLLCDGLHLSTAGSKVLFSLLLPIVNELTTDLPMKFPLWDQVDTENLKPCLVP